MRISILTLMILIVLSSSIVFAGNAGGDPCKFTLLGAYPRAIARGQAHTADNDHIENFLYNPAGIINIEGYQFGFAYQSLALDRTMYSLVFGGNINNDAAFALSMIHSGVDITGRDRDGLPTGSIDNSEISAALTFSKFVTREFAIGGNVRYYYASLTDDMISMTAGFDAGVLYHSARYGLNIGAAVQNINMKTSWNSSDYYGSDGMQVDEDIPLTIRIGTAYRLPWIPLDVSLDGVMTDNRETKIHTGLKYEAHDQIDLMVGMNHDLFTAGFSFEIPVNEKYSLNFDYAFGSEQYDLAARHILGIRFDYK